MESNAVHYEVVKKSDVSFIIPVELMEAGDKVVTAKTSVGDIVFNNLLGDGNLENAEWAIREVGTHQQADGTGVVEVVEGVVENLDVAPVVEEVVAPVEETVVVEEVAPTV